MSRRTKFIIATVFLVLLGIPAMHITCVWHPGNPLRFQVVEDAPGMWSDPPGSLGFKVEFVEITNTSAAPIYFASGILMKDRPLHGQRPDIGSIDLMMPPGLEPSFAAYDDIRVPPHGRAFAMAYVSPAEGPALRTKEGTGITVVYYWCAHPRLHVRNACVWLRKRLPEGLHPMIPEMTLGKDRRPLMPLATDTSPQAHPPSP